MAESHKRFCPNLKTTPNQSQCLSFPLNLQTMAFIRISPQTPPSLPSLSSSYRPQFPPFLCLSCSPLPPLSSQFQPCLVVKVSETGDNRWALLNPLTNDKLCFPSGVFHPRMINLLGFNNFEVGRSYRLHSVGYLGENSFDLGDYSSSIDVKKAAVKITLDELVVVVLNGFSGKWEMRIRFGQIWVWK